MSSKLPSIDERYAGRIPLATDEEEAMVIYNDAGTDGWLGVVALDVVQRLMDKGYFAPSGITDLGQRYLELEG